jgi:hypothetical protein
MGKMVRGFKEHKNAKAAMLFAIAALIVVNKIVITRFSFQIV